MLCEKRWKSKGGLGNYWEALECLGTSKTSDENSSVCKQELIYHRKPGFTPSTMASISSQSLQATAPSVPWRRPNVRHTSNELYVDIVETLSVTLAPSGRPLSAFSHGTIAFTAKISGVPDLLLNLSSPSGKHNLGSVLDLPVFHPCVRLNRWKERPGELSFVPPDGRFVLMGYEVDLLGGMEGLKSANSTNNLKLPVNLEVITGLGPHGADFEVKVTLSNNPGPATSGTSSSGFGGGAVRGTAAGGLARIGGSSSALGGGGTVVPSLEDLVVTVPLPSGVRNISELRPSRGDVRYNPGDLSLEWVIPTKEGPGRAPIGKAGVTLKGTIIGALDAASENLDDGNGFHFEGSYGESSYQSRSAVPAITRDGEGINEARDAKKVDMNKHLMPSSATLSFSVKGWLPSGIKVESLVVDAKKSKGLGEGVKPYKGVKYLCVSSGGVEVRC
jgi:AP-3 complex subunit mu